MEFKYCGFAFHFSGRRRIEPDGGGTNEENYEEFFLIKTRAKICLNQTQSFTPVADKGMKLPVLFDSILRSSFNL
jgi:hypothetical protein